MNQKIAKKIRKEVKRKARTDYGDAWAMFLDTVYSLPLRSRLRWAFKIARGRK